MGSGATDLDKPTAAERTHGPHTLSVGDRYDWFRVYLKAGFSYTFHTTGGTGDIVGELYADANARRQVASDDDSAGNRQFRITHRPPAAGWFWLRVRAFGGAGACSYTLRYSATRGGGPTPTPRPGVLAVNGPTRSGRINRDGQDDWYTFVASARNPHIIETSLGTLRDSVLELYGVDKRKQLAYNDDDGATLASRITYDCAPNRTYCVKVRSVGRTGTGGYTVRVRTGVRTTPAGRRAPVTFNGRLTFNGQSDWYTFVASTRNPHVIETSLGTLRDSVIELYSANGTAPLAIDDDGGPGLASRLTWNCTPGTTYRVRVRSLGNVGTGGYTLRITTDAGAGVGVGRRPPVTFRGRIDFNGERDSHTFVASTRNPHVIETSLGTLSDSVIYLYDAMGRTLASDDDGGVGLASRIVYNCTPGATYRVGVEGYMNRALGSYTLRITGNAGGGQFPLPQVGGGRLTVNGIARRGRITFGGDTDSYQFVASTRNPHVIETTLGTLSDSVLQLHDAMGRQIAYNDDDRAVGLASRITYNCTPGATYTVRVRGFSRRHTGTYSVRVRTFGGIAPLPPAPVPPIRPRRWPPVAPRQLPTTGLSSSGRLTGGADEDWYRFVASARNPHVIETTLGSLNDSYIYLYDAKGRQLANDDDGGVGLASKINYFCTAGRTYHVKVRAWGGGAGTYTVRVQATGRRPKSLPGPRPDPRPSTRGGRPPLAFNGRLDFNNDSDWYTFTASTRNPHVIETSLGTLSDSVIELYSATGTRPLVTDDDDGPGLASRIVHRCTPGRTYRVRVRAFGGRTGTYTLRITTFGR